MKKYLFRLASLVAIMSLWVACDNSANDEEQAKLTPIENATMAIYVDVNQIIDKSGIAPQRQVVASAIASEFTNPKDAEFIKSIILDLDNSGVRFSKPLYAIAELDTEKDGGLIYLMGEVCNVNNIDRLIQLINDMNGEEVISMQKDGDMRYMALDDDFYLAYNSQRIVIVGSSSNVFESVKNVMARNHYNLSVFGKRDAGIYLNIKDMLQVAMKNNPQFKDNLMPTYEQLADNAATTLGLAFKPGAITLDAQVYGFPENGQLTNTSIDHLALLPSSTVAVMDMGFDGPAIVEAIKPYISNDIAYAMGVSVNDFNTIKNIIFDAINSLQGDITLALTEWNGYIDEVGDYEYNEYWDEWEYYSYTDVDMDDTNIALIADTRNEYIIGNLGMLFDYENYNHYSKHFDGGRIDVKQDGKLLRGNYTVSMDGTYFTPYMDVFETPRYNLSNARWINDIKNSFSYLVFDVNAAANSEFGSSLLNYVGEQAGYPASDIIYDVVNMSDYIFMRHSTNGIELTWKFDNTSANALEQIVRLALTYAM